MVNIKVETSVMKALDWLSKGANAGSGKAMHYLSMIALNHFPSQPRIKEEICNLKLSNTKEIGNYWLLGSCIVQNKWDKLEVAEPTPSFQLYLVECGCVFYSKFPPQFRPNLVQYIDANYHDLMMKILFSPVCRVTGNIFLSIENYLNPSQLESIQSLILPYFLAIARSIYSKELLLNHFHAANLQFSPKNNFPYFFPPSYSIEQLSVKILSCFYKHFKLTDSCINSTFEPFSQTPDKGPEFQIIVEPNFTPILVHKNILLRSQFFSSMIGSSMKESQDRKIILNSNDYNFEIVSKIFKFLYSGDSSTIVEVFDLELLETCHRLDFKEVHEIILRNFLTDDLDVFQFKYLINHAETYNDVLFKSALLRWGAARADILLTTLNEDDSDILLQVFDVLFSSL